MNFDFDNSTQTNTALSTTGTSDTYVNSNDLSTKQNLLDVSTNLLGIGTSISALNYNNITLNKPTNFQSDWTSTIINKPDLSVYALNTSLSTINASNITSGVFTVSRGGTGTNFLYANHIFNWKCVDNSFSICKFKME
jgi:hypothetical protein